MSAARRPTGSPPAGGSTPGSIAPRARLALVAGLAAAVAIGCVGPSGLGFVPAPGDLAAPVAGHGGVGRPVLADAAGALAWSQFEHDAALRAERAGSPACVDGFYRSAVWAYAALAGPAAGFPAALPPGLMSAALARSNAGLADALRAAPAFGRLDPRSHLRVAGPAGMVNVPIAHVGFVWRPDDFQRLVDHRAIKDPLATYRSRHRAGLGAPQVVVREAGPAEPPDRRFLPRRHAFAATAVLAPDLDAWLGRRAGPPGDRLLLYDPLRVRLVALPDGRAGPLAADVDAPLSLLSEMADMSKYQVISLFRPEVALKLAGLYLLEPYQPGKVPVVLVHGLASTPLTWNDMIGDLRADPAFLRDYQIALFTYPTGLGFLGNAATLRRSLDELQATGNADGGDPAAGRMVLVGHSMGGLLAKLQITSSGDRLWDAFATRPFDQLVASPEIRADLADRMFFEPRPYVRRVVYVATPHQGADVANRLFGRIVNDFIRLPDLIRDRFREVRRDNPGLLRPGFRKQPRSIDLLRSKTPLLQAMDELPRAADVPYHTIAGTGRYTRLIGEPGDGVVPVPSARQEGAASEIFVPDRHTGIHHHQQTVDEVLRILDEHRAAP